MEFPPDRNYDGRMRIIGGKWRRRQLVGPQGLKTRPMPDRVREAVCETVGSRFGTVGALPPIRVLDLFAGSGGSGLEALSRGASWCGFVERNGLALKALRRNIAEVLGQDARRLSTVIRADAYRPSAWAGVLKDRPVDVVFVDPPYADTRASGPSDRVGRLLEALDFEDVLSAEGIVVLRHESKVRYDAHRYGALASHDVRRYGSTTVTYLGRST